MNQEPIKKRPNVGAINNPDKKNLVVNYLLLNMSKLILANIAPDHGTTKAVLKAAKETERKLKEVHTEAELEPVELMVSTILEMAQKLADCDDFDTLNACFNYMRDMNKGDIYIMPDVANPEDYGLTPNR